MDDIKQSGNFKMEMKNGDEKIEINLVSYEKLSLK
jgi:hypothetical protein